MPTKGIRLKDIDSTYDGEICEYEEVSVCPVCNFAIVPKPLDGYLVQSKNTFTRQDVYSTFITLFCPYCRTVFLAKYRAYPNRSGVHTNFTANHWDKLYPQSTHKSRFSALIEKLSPMFATVYNQSEAAEAQGLSEIAGCGYRKSLEYLVKDYLCHKSPDQAEDIKAEFLGKSIGRINDPRIKTLAERATWIGNDETHYTKKHEDRDTEDMKRFIGAILNYVDSELTFEDALSVPPKK